jgi:hypothetical protein
MPCLIRLGELFQEKFRRIALDDGWRDSYIFIFWDMDGADVVILRSRDRLCFMDKLL